MFPKTRLMLPSTAGLPGLMFYVITLPPRLSAVKQNVIHHYMSETARVRKPQKSYHHGDLSDALVAAALRMAEAEGPEAVSFSALARELGVTQAAPYRHFADRDALLTAAATEAFRLFAKALREAVAKASRRTPLERMAHAYLKFGRERAGLYRLMYAARLVERSLVGSELQRAVEDGFLAMLDYYGPATNAAAREIIALKFWAALHGVVMLGDQGLLPLKVRKLSAEDLAAAYVKDAERDIAALTQSPG